MVEQRMPSSSLVSLLGRNIPAKIDEKSWNRLIQSARQSDLLGQLAASLTNTGLDIHWRVQRAFDLELLSAQRRTEAALWELEVIRRLVPRTVPIVVLKGCAYALAGDHNAKGRLFSDIDLLIPANFLGDVESALIAGGWKPSAVSTYDQHYYRNWMHELPPMEHVRRRTVVDLHHAIVPTVSRYAFDPTPLFDQAEELSSGLFVLSPKDRVIHSSLHAFLEGVPSKALRDLYDINCLLRQHFPEDQQTEALLSRSEELGVKDLVRDAITASATIFINEKPQTPGQETLRSKLLANAALSAITVSPQGRIAAQWLLAHSHWMKMPFRLLLPHLARKTWIRFGERQSNA